MYFFIIFFYSFSLIFIRMWKITQCYQSNDAKKFLNTLKIRNSITDPTFVYRWPQLLLRLPQHIRAHLDVLLLLLERSRTKSATLPLVEEIFNHLANGSIHPCDIARVPASFHRMWLSENIRLVDRHARSHVLLFVP